MSLQELSNFTILSKYSKYLPELQRRETWPEIVDRSLNMHLKKFDYLSNSDKDEIRKAFQLVKEKKVLPSMRSAQNAGPGIEKSNCRIYNCTFGHIYNTRAIEKAFYLLLCGVGCGFGLTKKWVDKFPALSEKPNWNEEILEIHYVEDSIEGWARSTKLLIDSYLQGNPQSGHTIYLDYSKIRPKGSPISHGGTAPGPDGLKLAHEHIRNLLDNLPGDKLRTIDVYDILMYCSDAVLSGGIRRAASIALFQLDDELMLRAKTGNWLTENPQRRLSNNTVVLNRNTVTKEDFHYILEITKQFGEPGFAFVNDINTGLNPCAEVQFQSIWNGIPVWQFCNLTNINGNKIETLKDFFDYTEAATIIGTLQAAYTDFKFLDREDRMMTEEEALLGVGILGSLSNPQILNNSTYKREAARLAVITNERWSEKIGINRAARVTCVKPDGNSSCVLESPFSGIHAAHAPYYIRRSQVNKEENIYKHFKKYNPSFCENSVYNSVDGVISFPIKVDKGMLKSDLSAIEHLEIIKDTDLNWVKEGEKNNKRDVHHSVSCTVLVDPEDWKMVGEYLYENRAYFTSVALLERNGSEKYPQAPYEEITEEEYYALQNKLNVVEYKYMIEKEDNTKRSEEIACSGGACVL